MSVTKEQIGLVQDTWSAVKSKGSFEDHGTTLFARLCEISPEMFKVFPFSEGSTSWADLKEVEKMKRNGDSVLKALDGAVVGLNDLSAVETVLLALGGRHINYGLTPEYLEKMKPALLYILETNSGVKWSPDAKAAWVVVYGFVAATMLKGLNAAK